MQSNIIDNPQVTNTTNTNKPTKSQYKGVLYTQNKNGTRVPALKQTYKDLSIAKREISKSLKLGKIIPLDQLHTKKKTNTKWDLIQLSQTSKLNSPSFPLPAGTTCPGSTINGETVPACRTCYAMSGNYVFNQVKAPREHNLKNISHPDFVPHMIHKLKHLPLFRWFDSGDIFSIEFLEKIIEICKGTPNTRHWIPTRSFVVPEFQTLLKRLNSLPNVALRPSSGQIDGSYNPFIHRSTVIPSPDYYGDTKPHNVYVCPSYKQDGRCDKCIMCYKKNNIIVAYIGHGKSFNKVYRETTGLTPTDSPFKRKIIPIKSI